MKIVSGKVGRIFGRRSIDSEIAQIDRVGFVSPRRLRPASEKKQNMLGNQCDQPQ